MASKHTTVLLNEAIEGLNLKSKSIVVDATFGGGGHSLEICKRFPAVKIIAIDQDQGAFERPGHKFQGCDLKFANENFRYLDKALAREKVKEIDAIIFDLGLSSDQLESSGRGFSFMRDEPLLMTMKANPSRDEVTAYDVVNTWSEESLADIIYGYGEERYARRIARGIVEARKQKAIATTFELRDVIRGSVPKGYSKGRIHFATKTFQAIRIAVNDELGALREGLTKGFQYLGPRGRMAVISFHSLEDRTVKKFYKEKAEQGEGLIINKKVITASEGEIKSNNRSRSAKLRVIEKIK